MMDVNLRSDAEFDKFAEDYDRVLAQGIGISGESKEFFAERRVAWLARCLAEQRAKAESVVDFGCGIGTSTPYLLDLLGAKSLVGLDVSPRSLEVARRKHRSNLVTFELYDGYEPEKKIDLVFCNGVFHHIPPKERSSAVHRIHRMLRTGGFFAFWENNPWNPGARYAMWKNPMDEDAICLWPNEARHMLLDHGFEILRTDFLFIFPRMLRSLRFVEAYLSRLPFGAQYQVLCRKP